MVSMQLSKDFEMALIFVRERLLGEGPSKRALMKRASTEFESVKVTKVDGVHRWYYESINEVKGSCLAFFA